MVAIAFDSRLVVLLLPLTIHVPVAEAAEPGPRSGLQALDLRLEATTFVLDLEKQGLQDNTFTDGLGRDTTLIGDLVNVTVSRRLASSLKTTVGVFANLPFGHDTVVSRVRPIARLTYTPAEWVEGIAGTLKVPHRDFLDGVFDDANRFLRPIEQGLQVVADSPAYRQDLFVNWEQAFGGSQPRRFDVGYAGQLRAGPFRFNGQMHWVQNGQALLKLDRSFTTQRNIVTALGPELVIEPGRYANLPGWWREAGVRATYLTSSDEPQDPQGRPTCGFLGGSVPCHGLIRGRGYELQVWLDLDGWRPRVGFWRGDGFTSQQGDPEYKAKHFTEVGLSKLIPLGEDGSLEFGTQVRKMPNFVVGEGSKWVNQHRFVLNWNFDTARTPLFGGMPNLLAQGQDEAAHPARSPLSARLDTLTYVYTVQFPGIRTLRGQPISEPAYAGEYLSPVLRYSPSPWLKLDAGVFAGLPVGSTQPFHTVQPILAAELEVLPQVSLVAGTLYRNHPFLDAIFNDAMLFTRPIEQGFQLLVNRPAYQQDFFINWSQLETSLKPERFDIGYAGRIGRDGLALNAQLYWDHAGGAQFSEARSLRPDGNRSRSTFNNFQAAVGPDLTVQPAEHWPALSWLREVGVMALYLVDENQPVERSQPVTRGRGYLLATGVDVSGWRAYVNFWRGENFIMSNGDPAYLAGNFTEYGLLKDVVIAEGFTVRVGGLARTITGQITHTEYVLLNWAWDRAPWRGYCLRPTLLHPHEKQCGLG